MRVFFISSISHAFPPFFPKSRLSLILSNSNLSYQTTYNPPFFIIKQYSITCFPTNNVVSLKGYANRSTTVNGFID